MHTNVSSLTFSDGYQLDPVLQNVGVEAAPTRALINGGLQIWCLFIAVSE